MSDAKTNAKKAIDKTAAKAKEIAGKAVDRTKAAAQNVGDKVRQAGQRIKDAGK